MAKLSPQDARKGARRKVEGSAPAAPTRAPRSAADGLVPVRESDSLEFEQWLLPPAPLSRSEIVIRRISMAAGPVLLVAVSLAIIYFFFSQH